MDDARLKAEFPLGDTLKVVVSEPTSAQGLVLALSRRPSDGDAVAQMRLVRRLFSIVEELVTTQVWDDVIENALITGAIDEAQLMDFVSAVTTFRWADHRPEKSDSPQPVDPEDNPPRPAPRVISGG